MARFWKTVTLIAIFLCVVSGITSWLTDQKQYAAIDFGFALINYFCWRFWISQEQHEKENKKK